MSMTTATTGSRSTGPKDTRSKGTWRKGTRRKGTRPGIAWPKATRPGIARQAAAAIAASAALLAAALAGPVLGAAPARASAFGVVSAGGNHSCAARTDGTVWCWGDDATSQLGSGTTASTTVPVQVPDLTGMVSVAAGYAHTCALDGSGGVWCWGSDAFGELGNGTTAKAVAAPAQVAGLTAQQISAGRDLTCAVTLSAQAECWGDNNFGELGDGNTADSSTPKVVKGLTGVVAVAAGYSHACALETKGQVFCWGSNTFGGLGNGTTTDSDKPVPVTGLDAGVTAIAAGADDSCAILTAGGLKCWGDNGAGQLGIGTFTDSDVPAQVAGLTSGVEQVTLGEDYGCAHVGAFSAVQCWGDAEGHGQLGDGSFNEDSPVPVPSFGLQVPPTGAGSSLPEQISAGAHHACLVLFSLQLECWGEGHFGALGTGSTLDHATAVQVIGLPLAPGAVYSVSAGFFTGCAVTGALNAACWGDDPGDGSLLSQRTSAVPVQNLPAGGVAQVVAGSGGCALTTTGSMACWGDNTWGEIGDGTMTDQPTPFTVGLTGVQSVTTGSTHVCALVQGSGAFCWGDNFHGDIGDGTTTLRETPVAVQNLPNKLAQIAAGGGHTCALLTDKFATVRCWGANESGELGNNSTSNSPLPVTVHNLNHVVQLALGNDFSCALTTAGGVSCWGDNQDGELGNGTTANAKVPTPVSGLSSGVLAIAAGDAHVCAVLDTGVLQCWGFNATGQLGNGGTTTSLVPGPVTGFAAGNSPVSINGGPFSCALNSSQQAQCWGLNTDGELGDGSLSSISTLPETVTGL